MTLELANNINALVERSDRLYREGILNLKNAIALNKEAGLMLIQAKESLRHGEFTKWVENNCIFNIRHAQRLMHIAKNWDKIIRAWEGLKNDTCDAFESPLPSLRQAITLAASEPKEEKPEPVNTAYKIANPQHSCFGETVKEVRRLNQGDIVVCLTSKGEFPFLKHELTTEDKPLQMPLFIEVVDAEIEDNSEQLREAIALVIEYLGERELQVLLNQSIDLGRSNLPVDIISKFCQLTPQLAGK